MQQSVLLHALPRMLLLHELLSTESAEALFNICECHDVLRELHAVVDTS